MRALLVCAAPSAGYEGLVTTLAAEADLVVAVDGGGALCVRAHVSPDVVVGDLDSLDAAAELELQAAGAEFVILPADKSETDLDVALQTVRDRGADEVVVCAALSGRLIARGAVGSLANSLNCCQQS
jgi:thiamine pyrophosphokinase